jgi:hypothetical protein
MTGVAGWNLPLGTVGKIKITEKNISISKERKGRLEDYLRQKKSKFLFSL